VACAVSDTCLGVSCCIYSSILKRSFELSFEIDVCRYALELQIESYKSTLLLDTSELGDWKFFTLQGLLKIRFVFHVFVLSSHCTWKQMLCSFSTVFRINDFIASLRLTLVVWLISKHIKLIAFELYFQNVFSHFNSLFHVYCSYRIIYVFEDNVFIIDAIVKLCLSDSESCLVDIPILQRKVVPKPFCQSEIGFKILGI
jgi:hypothetical protein